MVLIVRHVDQWLIWGFDDQRLPAKNLRQTSRTMFSQQGYSNKAVQNTIIKDKPV